jgi:hypothetical protein
MTKQSQPTPSDIVARLRCNAEVCRGEQERVPDPRFKAELANNAREWDEAARAIEAIDHAARVTVEEMSVVIANDKVLLRKREALLEQQASALKAVAELCDEYCDLPGFADIIRKYRTAIREAKGTK